MKVRVKYYDAEVEVELPDEGVAQDRYGSLNTPFDKNKPIFATDKRTACDVAIEVIAEACKGIRAIREGGAK